MMIQGFYQCITSCILIGFINLYPIIYVVIITTNTEGLAFDSVEDGVRVFRLPIKNLPQKNRLPFLKKDAEYKQFMSEIRAIEVDHVIINTRLYETTFLGLKIAKEKGIRPWIIDHSGGYVLIPYERVSFKKLSRFGLKNIVELPVLAPPFFHALSDTTNSESNVYSPFLFYGG